MSDGLIRIRGARQHNLKNINLDLYEQAELTVVTGPSGSGKSSLVFDTLFAEGQRRYVETFSAYARQFLDRMDKPRRRQGGGRAARDRHRPDQPGAQLALHRGHDDGAQRPPEAAVRARRAAVRPQVTALPVRHDTARSIYAELMARAADARPARGAVTFPVELPANTTPSRSSQQWLAASGFTRVHAEREVKPRPPARARCSMWWPIAFASMGAEKVRVVEAIELALKRGAGRMNVNVLPACRSRHSRNPDSARMWRFPPACTAPRATCATPTHQPSLFSFNSAMPAPARPAAASAA